MTTFMQLVMIKKKLERVLVKDFHTVVNWFYENYVILNTGKCLDTCIGKDVDENETLQISSKQFHQHTKSIFKKAGQRLSAFLRTFPYLEDKKRKLFIIPCSNPNLITVRQSGCSRKSNNLVNQVQERDLRLTYKDNQTMKHLYTKEPCNF